MPSSTPKQKKFMAAKAHGAKGGKFDKVPMEVAKEFHNADKGKYGHKPKKKE